MLPARFTRTFILVVVVLVLFSSLLLVLNTPSLAIRRPSSSSSYFDPNRGLVFDSDGVEKDIAVDQNKKKPWIVGGGGGGEKILESGDALFVMLWNQGMSFHDRLGSMNDYSEYGLECQSPIVRGWLLTLIARATP